MFICLQKVIFHEEYGQPDDYQNDIALIKLDREVGEGLTGTFNFLSLYNFKAQESSFVGPVCLPWSKDYLR